MQARARQNTADAEELHARVVAFAQERGGEVTVIDLAKHLEVTPATARSRLVKLSSGPRGLFNAVPGTGVRGGGPKRYRLRSASATSNGHANGDAPGPVTGFEKAVVEAVEDVPLNTQEIAALIGKPESRVIEVAMGLVHRSVLTYETDGRGRKVYSRVDGEVPAAA